MWVADTGCLSCEGPRAGSGQLPHLLGSVSGPCVQEKRGVLPKGPRRGPCRHGVAAWLPSLLSSGLSPARVWTGSRAGCRPRQRRGSALAPAHLSPHPCPTMLCGDLGPGRSTPRAKALCWGHVVGQAIADERVTGEEGVEASRCPRRSHLRSQTQLSAQAPRPPAGLGPP